jgi:hypothetical protein
MPAIACNKVIGTGLVSAFNKDMAAQKAAPSTGPENDEISPIVQKNNHEKSLQEGNIKP